MSALFSPFRLGDMGLKNRVVMSPTRTSVAGAGGLFGDLHFAHYAARLIGGVGMVITEAVAVDPAGRVDPEALGLWDDAQVDGLARLPAFAHSVDARACIQLGHAGRRAMLEGGIVAPSAIAYGDGHATPRALGDDEIVALVRAYRAAARRADRAGFDCLELNAAQGDLMHQFLAARSNHREDRWGGDLAGRARFVLEVTQAVREAWPAGKPLIVRVAATDLVEGGVTVDESTWLARQLRALGVDLLDVSSGGIVPGPGGDAYPGQRLKYVEALRSASGLPASATGSITSADHAETILASGAADLVFLGRELLRNPFWVIQAARLANVAVALPFPAYARPTGPLQRGAC